MSRKEVSMIGNLTRDMMRDVMETSLKKPIQTGEFRKNPGSLRCGKPEVEGGEEKMKELIHSEAIQQILKII